MPARKVSVSFPVALLAQMQEAAKAEGVAFSAWVAAACAEKLGVPHTPLKQGGDRLPARLKGVYIHVANGVAQVCKTVDGKTTPALNAADLAHWARLAVERRGSISVSGIYPCPPTLARKAKW